MKYEQWLAALCLWREARGSSLAAMTGIWWVLKNRASDLARRWPKTLPEVICQHAQFSSFSPGDPNATKFPLPSGGLDWAAWQDCQSVVETELGSDPTFGATNYHSIPPGGILPAWAQEDKLTVQIGVFKFYKL